MLFVSVSLTTFRWFCSSLFLSFLSVSSLLIWWASLVAQMVKNLPAVQETRGSIPGLGRSPGERNGNPLQYSCLGNPMDRGAWWATYNPWDCRVRHDWATNTFVIGWFSLLVYWCSFLSRFFLYKFIYFNWRLIPLQYCIGFAIHQHESTTGIHGSPSWTPLSLVFVYSIGWFVITMGSIYIDL